MKKGANVSEEKAESLDSNKKITKNVSENISKCDNILSSARSFLNLFNGQAIAARTRLREACERAIMNSSSSNKQKMEEILWRKVYYDPFSAAKKFRQGNSWSDKESGLVWAHLNDGIAYYHQILMLFCFTFKVSSDITADFLPIYNQGTEDDEVIKPPELSLKDSFFRSLTCLGDLTRYKLDLSSQTFDQSSYLLSVRYYHQALHYNSEGGLTHSNLATVYSTNNQPLLAAVHYLRAITCEKPFEAAENNLRRMLDRSRIWLENKKLEIEDLKENDLGKKSKQFLHSCLALVSYLMNDKKNEQVAVHCPDTLTQLGKLLDEYDNSEPSDLSESSDGAVPEIKVNGHTSGFGDSLKSHSSNNNNHTSSKESSTFFVNPESMVTLCSLLIVCAKRLKIQNSSHSHLSEVLIVTVLFTLVSHINTRLEQRFSLIDLSFVNHLIPVASADHEEKSEDTEKESEKIICNGVNDTVKKKKSKLSKLRRRMKCSDHLINDSDQESDNELNDGESDMELNDDSSSCSDIDDSVLCCDSEDEDSDEDVKIESDQEEWDGITADEHLQLIEQEGMLAAVYVTLFWFFNNEGMIKSFSQDDSNVWPSIAKLANLVRVDYDQIKIEESTSLETVIVEKMKLVSSLPKTSKSLNEEDCIPLPENLMLHLVIPSFQMNGVARNLKTSEQNLLRLYRINMMIHSLARREDTPLILEDNKFHVKKITKKTENEKNAFKQPVDKPPMQNSDASEYLTKQWLKFEVGVLQEKTSTNKLKLGGLYVVPDAAVLINHLSAIKKMMAMPSHMIIIPQVVIDSLDKEKKDSVGARDAIRWLEVKFRHGSRFIRAQRLHERTRLPLIKYPKRKDKEAWKWFNLAECCYYLGAQMSNVTKSKTSTVTLLTGESPNKASKLSFSRSTLTEAAGAVLQSVEEFTRKWQIKSIGHS